MSTILGREGSMAFGTLIIAEIRSFKITETIGSYDKNVMGSGEWDQSAGGRKSWTAEVECFYDPTATTGNTSVSIGDEAEGDFFPEGDTTGKQRRHGTCRVDEKSSAHSEDGLVELSLKMKGTGPLNDVAVV